MVSFFLVAFAFLVDEAFFVVLSSLFALAVSFFFVEEAFEEALVFEAETVEEALPSFPGSVDTSVTTLPCSSVTVSPFSSVTGMVASLSVYFFEEQDAKANATVIIITTANKAAIIFFININYINALNDASLGILQSPLGLSETEPTFGESGIQERLN